MKLKRIGDFDKKLLMDEIKDRNIIIEGEYHIPTGYNMYEILKDMRYSDGLDQQKVKKLSDDIFGVIPGLKSIEYYGKLKEEVTCELVASNPNNVEVLTFEKLQELSKLEGYYKLADEHYLSVTEGDASLFIIDIKSVKDEIHPYYHARALFEKNDDIRNSVNIINQMCSLFRVDNLNEDIEKLIFEKYESEKNIDNLSVADYFENIQNSRTVFASYNNFLKYPQVDDFNLCDDRLDLYYHCYNELDDSIYIVSIDEAASYFRIFGTSLYNDGIFNISHQQIIESGSILLSGINFSPNQISNFVKQEFLSEVDLFNIKLSQKGIEFSHFEKAIENGQDTVLKVMLETELRDVFIQEFEDGYGSHYFDIDERKVIESEVYNKIYEDFELVADGKIEINDCYKSFVLENFDFDVLAYRGCKHILDVVCEEEVKR